MQKLRNEFGSVLEGKRNNVLDSKLHALRGELKKGINCLIEESVQKKNGGNIMNRILIMSVEDCLHPGIIPVLHELYLKWNAYHEIDAGMSALLGAYAMVVGARKCKMMSVVKTIVSLSKNESDLDAAFVGKWRATMTVPPESSFEKLMFKGDIRCVCALPSITMQDAWRCMKSLSYDDQRLRVITTLEKLYNLEKSKAAILFLYHGIILTTFRHNIDSWSDVPDVPVEYSANQVVSTYRAHLKSKNVESRVDKSQHPVVHTANIVPRNLMRSFSKMLDSCPESKGIVHKQTAVNGNAPKKPKLNNKEEFILCNTGFSKKPEVTFITPPVKLDNGYHAATLAGEEMVMIKASDGRPDPVLIDAVGKLFGITSVDAKLVVVRKVLKDNPTGILQGHLVMKLIQGQSLKEMQKTKTNFDMCEFLRLGLVRSGILRLAWFDTRNVIVSDGGGGMVCIDDGSRIGSHTGAVFPKDVKKRKDMGKMIEKSLDDILKVYKSSGFTDDLYSAISDTGLLLDGDKRRLVDFLMKNLSNLEGIVIDEMIAKNLYA